MKKYLLFLFLILLRFDTHAQDICSDAQNMMDDFYTLSMRMDSMRPNTGPQLDAYKERYMKYRGILAQSYSIDMAQFVAIANSSYYMNVMNHAKRYKESIEDAKFVCNTFFPYMIRGQVECYVPFRGKYIIEVAKQQHIVATFFQHAAYTSSELYKPGFAGQVLMMVDANDMLGNWQEANEVCADLFNYKMGLKQVDDTTFTAAYGYLISKFAAFPENAAKPVLKSDPVDVFTDPQFLNYKPVLIKRYKYLYYHDYFSKVYTYFINNAADEKDEERILKMFLQVYNAEKKPKGIDRDFLDALVRDDQKGNNAVGKIAVSENKELAQLLANFIEDYVGKPKWATEYYLVYGAYLCYHYSGDDKKANKMFKKLGGDERFKKL